MAITDYSITSLASVVTKQQGFMSNEIEDEYLSHLDLNGFCTIDNTLQGVAGDIRTINTYGASGTAIDVAEGYGNSESIATTLTPARYQIKCAQAWFRYSDEALMRDPIAVKTGTTHLGTALFNKVNGDIYTAMKSVTGDDHTLTVTAINFNAMVDAVAKLDIKDAAGESAMDAQERFLPQVFCIMGKNEVALARKAMKDQLVYDPQKAWLQGYVGEIAGVTLFYKQDATSNTLIVGTNKAVTVFNKTGVEYEVAARNGGAQGTANLRYNDVYARKYYIAALTDANQICKVTVNP